MLRRSLLQADRLLHRRPRTCSFVIGGALGGAGDATAQSLEQGEVRLPGTERQPSGALGLSGCSALDWRRTAAMAVFSGAFAGGVYVPFPNDFENRFASSTNSLVYIPGSIPRKLILSVL